MTSIGRLIESVLEGLLTKRDEISGLSGCVDTDTSGHVVLTEHAEVTVDLGDALFSHTRLEDIAWDFTIIGLVLPIISSLDIARASDFLSSVLLAVAAARDISVSKAARASVVEDFDVTGSSFDDRFTSDRLFLASEIHSTDVLSPLVDNSTISEDLSRNISEEVHLESVRLRVLRGSVELNIEAAVGILASCAVDLLHVDGEHHLGLCFFGDIIEAIIIGG